MSEVASIIAYDFHLILSEDIDISHYSIAGSLVTSIDEGDENEDDK